MSYKNNVSVRVCGKMMTLSGNESVEYITKVATYIEEKADELRKSDNSKSLNPNLISVLTSINIADDYFKERDKYEKSLQEIEKLKSIQQKTDAEVPAEEYKLQIEKLKSDLDSERILSQDLTGKLVKTTEENEDLKQQIEEFKSRILLLEEDLKKQIAKINHIKSNEYKMNVQRKFEKVTSDNPVEIQEAIITDKQIKQPGISKNYYRNTSK